MLVPVLFKVKLLTPEGHLKHEEECNPQNGYYMIPVYNKGQYSLKVAAPEGWFFGERLRPFQAYEYADFTSTFRSFYSCGGCHVWGC